ncbi:hypothetical protein KQI63_07770 [bacterium]|nr:hypothetical protein [bacterium]
MRYLTGILLFALITAGCTSSTGVVTNTTAVEKDDRAPDWSEQFRHTDELDEIDFDAFLAQLYNAPSADRQAMVDSFLTVIEGSDEYGFPLVSEDQAVYIYTHTSASTVTLPGDHNGWTAADDVLARVSGTNFWFRRKNYPNDARLDYKLVVDGNWILDPRNPHRVYGGYGPNSEMAMPGYVQPVEIQEDPDIPHGTIDQITFESDSLNNSRTVRIYTPPGYDPENEIYPVIYVHDGGEYISLGSMDHVLDYSIANGYCEPLIAVFVDPVNRMDEYWRNDAFMEMFVHELIPAIEADYAIEDDPSRRAVMGCSLGGVTSVYFGLHYPNVFGKIAGHSSALWIDGSATVDEVEANPMSGMVFYLDTGTFEGSTYLDDNRRLRDVLRDNGNQVTYTEWHEAHSWGNWRAHIDDILYALFHTNSVPE